MSPWVERLAALVEWQPLNLAISWPEIEAELGVELPPDYKEFCEVFGQGEFSDWLEVFSSIDGKRHLLPRTLAALRRFAQGPRGATFYEPYHIFDGKTGLIPWANTEQGYTLFWDVQPGERWATVMSSDIRPWRRFEADMSEVVARVLTDPEFDYSIANDVPVPTFGPTDWARR